MDLLQSPNTMNQAEVGRVVRTLGIKLIGPRRIKNPMGPVGTLELVRASVSSLISEERIHLKLPRAQLTRLYTERLISEAILHGDRHRETMRIASWWLESDPAALHKLFQVLVPRYSDSDRIQAYTRIFKAPLLEPYDPERSYRGYYGQGYALLELRGHPFPPLALSNTRPNRKHIHNVLLSEARKEMESERRKEEDERLKDESSSLSAI